MFPPVYFLNFLRGMETVSWVRAETVEGNFLNFLRGMETDRVAEGKPVKVRFLNFLRGMETKPALLTHLFHSPLPKLP